MAKYVGLKVFATAGSDKGLDVAKSCGADFVYNHHDEQHVKQILVGAILNLVPA